MWSDRRGPAGPYRRESFTSHPEWNCIAVNRSNCAGHAKQAKAAGEADEEKKPTAHPLKTGVTAVQLIAVTGYGQEVDRQRTTRAGSDII